MNPTTDAMPTLTRNFTLRIVGGSAAAVLGAESSVLGWTVSNVTVIALAVALVTLAFEEVLRRALPEGYSRNSRFAFSGVFATMAVVAVVLAFRSSAMPV